jgi:uncharacterized Zn finger protein
MSALAEMCRELTWGQLAAWSNPWKVEKGRRIRREGAVRSVMSVREGMGVLAWVEAEEPFAVLLEFDGGALFARCSCNPLVYPCEHAVAVIIEYIAHLKAKKPIPPAPRNDPRYYLI